MHVQTEYEDKLKTLAATKDAECETKNAQLQIQVEQLQKSIREGTAESEALKQREQEQQAEKLALKCEYEASLAREKASNERICTSFMKAYQNEAARLLAQIERLEESQRLTQSELVKRDKQEKQMNKLKLWHEELILISNAKIEKFKHSLRI